jgi:hypothetical protein
MLTKASRNLPTMPHVHRDKSVTHLRRGSSIASTLSQSSSIFSKTLSRNSSLETQPDPDPDADAYMVLGSAAKLGDKRKAAINAVNRV